MEIELILVSLIAGVLTILAPCMLPLLPILIGGSAAEKGLRRPLTITVSLMVSMITFTLLLKIFTDAFNLDQDILIRISAVILIVFGFLTLFPQLWDQISIKTGLNSKTNKALGSTAKHKGFVGDVLIGSALGPVFSSCSPTFALIVATILPTQLGVGIIYLIIYALGLGIMMMLIAFGGQKAVAKLGWATDPHGKFKKFVGIMIVVIGIAIFFGLDKDFEALLIEQGIYDGLTDFENKLRE